MPTFGDTTPGGDAFPGNSDRALLDRATLTEAATLIASWNYAAAGSTAGANWKGLIYTDSASAPSARSAVSAAAAASSAAAWVTGSLSGSLTAADYWIGVVADSFQAYYGEDATGTTPDVVMANGTLSYASPNATWPGTDASYGVGLNSYVEYSAGAGAATSLLLPNRAQRLLPYLMFRNSLAERFSRFRLPPKGVDILVEHFRERGLLANRGAFAL